MENENIWKTGLVVLVLIAVFGVYYNNTSDGVEGITGRSVTVPYWEKTGFSNLNIFYNTGNVGIGTSNPMGKLDVNGRIKSSGMDVGLSSGGVGLNLSLTDASQGSNAPMILWDARTSNGVTSTFGIRQSGNGLVINRYLPTLSDYWANAKSIMTFNNDGNVQFNGNVNINGNTNGIFSRTTVEPSSDTDISAVMGVSRTRTYYSYEAYDNRVVGSLALTSTKEDSDFKRVGVYGRSPMKEPTKPFESNTGDWAGYFVGDVKITGKTFILEGWDIRTTGLIAESFALKSDVLADSMYVCINREGRLYKANICSSK